MGNIKVFCFNSPVFLSLFIQNQTYKLLMAQFIAFEEGVEVNGQTILSIVKALPVGQEMRSEILSAHGIGNPEAEKWYSQQAWLNAFKELSGTMGDKILFNIGESIPEYAVFPTAIDTLEKALKSIDQAYHMNHRGGEIGSYRVAMFNEKERKAVMVCQTPYPSELDRGIICTMLKEYRPASSQHYTVDLDTTTISRTKGNNSCTYNISW